MDEIIQPAPIENEPSPSPKTETRGRHLKTCTCPKCENRRLSKQQPAQQVNEPSPAVEQRQQVAQPTPQVNEPSRAVNEPFNLQGQTIHDTMPLNLDEYKQVNTTINQQSPTPAVNVAKYITGGFVLMLIDSIAPATILFVMRFFSERFQSINAKDIKLDDDQIDELTPIANEAMKTMTMTMHPMTAFVLLLGGFYAGNVVTATSFETPTPSPKKKGK